LLYVINLGKTGNDNINQMTAITNTIHLILNK
jgi:hypothetical protein